MKNLNKKSIMLIVYVLMCFCFLYFFNKNSYYDNIYFKHFENKDFTPKFENTYEIQQNDYSDYSGVFTYGPYIGLPKGEYNITINYNTNDDNNYIDIYSNGKLISKDMDVSLDKNENFKTVNLKLDENIEDLEIRTYYGGYGYFKFNGIDIESTDIIYNDSLFISALIFLALVVLGIKLFGFDSQLSRLKIFKNNNKFKLDYKILFVLAVFTVFISYPLFNTMIISGHDTRIHVARIEGIMSGLLAGQFPVRIHPNSIYGYGYGSSCMYPELFLYIPAVLRIMGISMPLAYNSFLVLINIFTVFISYISFSRLFKEKYIGLLASILYSGGIYRLCNIYTRGDLGEALSFIFLPLVMYGLYEIIIGESKNWGCFAVGITGVMQSHILSAFMVVISSVVFLVAFIGRLKEKQRILSLIKAGIVIVLVNLWFIVPFLQFNTQQLNVKYMQKELCEHSTQITHLLQIFPKAGGIGTNIHNRTLSGLMALTVGFPIMFSSLLCLYSFMFYKKDENYKNVLCLLSFGLFLIFVSTDFFPWHYIYESEKIGKYAAMFQFPWRVLSLASLFLSGAGAYGLYKVIGGKNAKYCILSTVLVSVVFSGYYLTYYTYNGVNLTKTDIVTTVQKDGGEYFPLDTDYNYIKGQVRVDSNAKPSAGIVIDEYEKNLSGINLTYHTSNIDDNGYIDVPLLSYTGYKATDENGNNLKTEKNEHNTIRVFVGSNKSGNISVFYKESILWRICTLISVLSLIVIIITHINRKKFKK